MGCPATTLARFCEKHAAEEQRRYDRARGSAAKRGYGGKTWKWTRRRILMRDPFCKAGCGRASTEADHVVPKTDGGGDEDSNLQGLCKPCHSAKTAREGRRWGGASNVVPIG